MKKQTIQIKQDTKDDFEKVRFRLKIKEKRLITQDEFMKDLLKSWKANK